jgi:hypothetical protein
MMEFAAGDCGAVGDFCREIGQHKALSDVQQGRQKNHWLELFDSRELHRSVGKMT